jgi:hypothetical protein
MVRIFNCKYGKCIKFNSKTHYYNWYKNWEKIHQKENSDYIYDRIPGHYFQCDDSEYEFLDSFKLWVYGLKKNPFTSVPIKQ